MARELASERKREIQRHGDIKRRNREKEREREREREIDIIETNKDNVCETET